VTGLLSWFFEDFRKIWITDTPRKQCVIFAGASIIGAAYILQAAAVSRWIGHVIGLPMIAVPLIVGTLLFFSCAVLRAVDSQARSNG